MTNTHALPARVHGFRYSTMSTFRKALLSIPARCYTFFCEERLAFVSISINMQDTCYGNDRTEKQSRTRNFGVLFDDGNVGLQ